jgi:hypothetical protein
MNPQIEQLNDDLRHAEATLRDILESSNDWLDADIREDGDTFVRGLQRRIIELHPDLGWVIDPLEF